MTTDLGLIFEKRLGYALCRYEGPFQAFDLVEAAKLITSFCAEHRFSQVLIDLRGSIGELTVEDRYVVANNIRYNAPSSLRVAICIRDDQGDAQNTWSTMMSEHGFLVRAFVDPAPAVEWLLSQGS